MEATRYARSGDVSIAYQVVGDGPPMLLVPGWVSHIEYMWEDSIFGPFLGVTLSLFALQHAPAAVATSIFAISPLFAIAIGVRFHREPVTVRTILGALLAVGGVLLLFSRHF